MKKFLTLKNAAIAATVAFATTAAVLVVEEIRLRAKIKKLTPATESEIIPEEETVEAEAK